MRNNTWRIPTSVRISGSRDGAVLLDIDRGRCFSLNATGARIWSCLQEGCSRIQILDLLSQNFGSVPIDTLNSNLDNFLSELSKKGLIQSIQQ